jgi:predicted NBD/HSP70 family sugar kinase
MKPLSSNAGVIDILHSGGNNMGKNYLAFDVGGTTIKYSLIDENLNLTQHGKVDTKHNEDNHILKTLKEITKKFQAEFDLVGVGVSTAGIVAEDGSIQYAGPTIPNYINTPLKLALADQSKLPVSVVNDVDAALLGEAYASQLDSDDIYCVALGTGIGGAHYQNGQLIGGSHGKGNSIGYTMFDPKSGTNYEQRASTLTLEGKLNDYDISVIDAFEKAKANKAPYVDIIKDWATQVATGLAEIIVLFDPEYIIVGGAVSAQGEYLIGLLNDALDILLPPNFNQTTLKIAKQGNNAQLIGAIVPLIKK